MGTGHPIPDELRTQLRAIPIALWCSDFTPGSFREREQLPQRFRVGFGAVEGAYVACVATADALGTLKPAEWTLRCGRTNDFGWVLKRERSGLGEESEAPRSGWRQKKASPAGGVAAPRDSRIEAEAHTDDEPILDAADAGVRKPREFEHFGPDDAVMLELDMEDANAEALFVLPNEHYRIFWTYDKSLFADFLDDFAEHPQGALDKYLARSYVVRPFDSNADVEMLRELSPFEQAFVARQLFTDDTEGYHAGWPSTSGMAAAIFDGTPTVLRSLYLCEWLHWSCVSAVQEDPHWPYLMALRSAISTALAGAAIPDLEVRMPVGDKAKRAGQVRAYLHGLAREGFDARREVATLVDVWGESATHGHWKLSAEALGENDRYGHRHPALAGHDGVPDLEEFRFSEDERAALVAYFDMYALGFGSADDAAALDAHLAHVQAAVSWVQARLKQRLAAIRHDELMKALALHVPRSHVKQRINQAGRFLYLCSTVEVRFWEAPHAELTTAAAWDAYKPFLLWLAEGSGLLAQLFGDFLQRYLLAYRNMAGAAAEQAVQYLYRYHLTLTSKAFESTLPLHDVTVRIEPDPKSGRIAAKLFANGKATKLLELELLTKVGPMPGAEPQAPVGAVDTKTRFARFQRAIKRGQVREFRALQQTVSVPNADLLEGLPKALAMTAAAIKTSLAVEALVRELDQKPWTEVDSSLYLNLTQESLQALQPGTDLLGPLLARLGPRSGRAGTLLMAGGAHLAKGGLALESARNICAGMTTLATFYAPGSSQTDLAVYLQTGQSVAAVLETTKGVIQVALGTGGFGSLVLGGATVVAGMTLSTWLAVGLVCVATADVVIYADTGGINPTQRFEARVRTARAEGLPVVMKRILLPGEELPSVDGSQVRPNLASSRLAKRLGTLHHVTAT